MHHHWTFYNSRPVYFSACQTAMDSFHYMTTYQALNDATHRLHIAVTRQNKRFLCMILRFAFFHRAIDLLNASCDINSTWLKKQNQLISLSQFNVKSTFSVPPLLIVLFWTISNKKLFEDWSRNLQ